MSDQTAHPAVRLTAIEIDAANPKVVAEFWRSILNWQPVVGEDSLAPNDDTGFRLTFPRTTDPKRGQNQIHFDLTSGSQGQQDETVARALALGGAHVDVGQLPEEKHVVLGDPEGNEFCVIEPGNRFLADCGFLGAVNCDGSRALGRFWSSALGWPLVWDQDEETAIRSPNGGPMVTWSGPPLRAKVGRNRMRFEVAPFEGGLFDAADRLVALGATLVSADGDFAAFADPDGNEFSLRPASTVVV
jgi:hypothetical protein